MKKLYIVKLGGSVITQTSVPGRSRPATISRLFDELRDNLNGKQVILGHGAGSFAHVPAKKFRVSEGLVNKESSRGAAITQYSASQLHQIVMRKALDAGLCPVSFSPSASATANAGRITTWDINPLRLAIKNGFLPITHGDVVMDKAQGVSVASTEEVFRYLAARFRPYCIITATDVDGIFTSDPKTDDAAELIPEVNSDNISEMLKLAKGSQKTDVTGGMRGKLEHLYLIARQTGTHCLILNANEKGRLGMALSGRKVRGTLIRA